MGILDASPTALESLVNGHVRGIAEFNFDSNRFEPVFGPPIPPIAWPDASKVRLTPGMVIAYFTCPPGPVQTEVMAASLSLLYQRNWTARLLQATLKPLDVGAQSDAYFAQIASRVLEAMRGRYVVIRLIQEEEEQIYLECVAMEDLRGHLPPSDLKIYDIPHGSPNAPIYKNVAAGFQQARRYMRFLRRSQDKDAFASMTAIPGTNDIKTIIVAALTIGDKVRGFINVGYDCNLELNEYMEATFATAFNHMCSAIEMHQATNVVMNLRQLEADEWSRQSNLEFMQGFRHNAQNELMSADIAARQMLNHYTYKGEPKDDPASTLQHAHRQMQFALERMASMKKLSEGKVRADVATVLDEAVKLLEYQINEAEATVRITRHSKDVTALLNVQAMRDAFGNLILNSLEAFQQANSRRSDRKISVSFRKDKDVIAIDFIDDGPGVRPGGGNIRQTSDIWMPERTSKKKGTGYGLPFVRRIIQQVHDGSIDLRAATRGAHFRIVMRDGLAEE